MQGVLAGLAPACLLVALTLAPAWGNPSSSFGFEPDKVWLLTLLLGIGLGALLAGRAGGPAVAVLCRPSHLVPLGVVVAAGVSTAFSLQPAWSWWGSPQRAGGLLSLLILLAAFWLAWAWLAQPAARQTLAAAIVFSSVPVLLVAVWQRAGWPLPAPWAVAGFAGRAFSTLGNPAFLSSYLLLVLPLTLALLFGAIGIWRAQGPGAAGASVCLALLAAGQGLLIFWTRARAGWLGLVAGIAFAGLLFGVRRHKRWLAALSTLGVAALLVGALFVMQMLRLDGQWSGAAWGRRLDPTGSGRQRLELWSQTEAYLLSGRVAAGRWLVGFGPDAQALVVPNQVTFRSTTADKGESPVAAFDRGHNLWLDVMLAGGVLGLLAMLALCGAVAWAGLRWLGWRASWGRGVPGLVAGLVVASATAGLPPLLARLAGGDGWLSPAGVGIGLAAGLCAGLCWLSFDRRGWESPTPHTTPQPLMAAGLVGLFAHWIELQFSFETSAAGLLTWVYLAALLRGAAEAQPAAADGVAPWRLTRSGPLFALLSGVVLVVVVAVAGLAGAALPVALLAALWLAGAAWVVAWDGLPALAWYPLLSLALPIGVWLAARLVETATARPLALTFLAWAVMAGCAGAIGLLLRSHARPTPRETLRFAQSDRLRHARSDRLRHAERSEASRETLRFAQSDRLRNLRNLWMAFWRSRTTAAFLRVAIGLSVALAGVYLAARPAAGSILTLRGLQLAQEGQVEGALAQLDRALAWGVQDSLAYDALAQVRLLQARQATGVVARQERLSDAAAAMHAAWDASPYQAGFGRRLALIYREWAEATPDAEGRRAHLDEARAALDLAVQHAPADARLRAELAELDAILSDGR